MAQEVEILDDEMQSRFEEIHGPDGLCHVLIELFNAMAELRLKAEYGDYLAYTCAVLKGNDMDDMKWKLDKLDWQEVAERIRQEEKTLAEEKTRRLPISQTPYLNDIKEAAKRLGHEVSLARYQIIAYAERSNFCHSGLKALIHNGDFPELAKLIMDDKASLDVIFEGSHMIKLR